MNRAREEGIHDMAVAAFTCHGEKSVWVHRVHKAHLFLALDLNLDLGLPGGIHDLVRKQLHIPGKDTKPYDGSMKKYKAPSSYM